MSTAIISEVFGPTVQGEGPTAGQRCAFVRFGLCNLTCRWCDTPYTWDWRGVNGFAFDKAAELSSQPIDDIVARLDSMDVDRAVITGGEPLIQGRAHRDLAVALLGAGYTVETETNGTLMPHDDVVALGPMPELRWNVSPKLYGSAAGTASQRLVFDVLVWFQQQESAIFKFVIAEQGDLDEVGRLIDSLNLDADRVWLMPEGRTVEDLTTMTPIVAQAAVDLGVNFTSRLHVLAWGDVRGH